MSGVGVTLPPWTEQASVVPNVPTTLELEMRNIRTWLVSEIVVQGEEPLVIVIVVPVWLASQLIVAGDEASIHDPAAFLI